MKKQHCRSTGCNYCSVMARRIKKSWYEARRRGGRSGDQRKRTLSAQNSTNVAQTASGSEPSTEFQPAQAASTSCTDLASLNLPEASSSCPASSSTDDDSSAYWSAPIHSALAPGLASPTTLYGYVTSFRSHSEYDSLIRLKLYEIEKRIPVLGRLPAQVQLSRKPT